MDGVIFQRTYPLGDDYDGIKHRAAEYLGKWLGYPNLYRFDDTNRSITFSSERLIPPHSTNSPRVMLLFSNPHPHSVYQGMFLSPNSNGRGSDFWPLMADSSWLPIPGENRYPKQLADICLNAKYPGPFDLIFFCYYPFPTRYPDDIRKIFGIEYFREVIEPEASEEFRKNIFETSAAAVVTFNKEIFNIVSKAQVERTIDTLRQGEIIRSQIKGIARDIPIYLTFPTGWRYHKEYKQLRKVSLEKIRKDIEKKIL